MKIDNQISIGRALTENSIKHILILLICLLIYNPILNEFQSVRMINLGEFLMVISIFLVTACFANFASSYEITDISRSWMRILSQSASFIFLLLIAMLLQAMVTGILIFNPEHFRFGFLFSLLLYLGIILYDYWDFLRCFVRT